MIVFWPVDKLTEAFEAGVPFNVTTPLIVIKVVLSRVIENVVDSFAVSAVNSDLPT